MLLIYAQNVNDALYTLAEKIHFNELTEIKNSRNGKVKAFIGPVTTLYRFPRRRVLRSPMRDANPFFHLFESLWMLGGRKDVAFPANYAKQIREYSDDGFSLHGAYGYRWFEHFKVNQIERVINELRADMNTRRAVVSMWDPYIDPDVAAVGGKDVPCNTQIFFSFKHGALDMTVINRSNDMVWGAYGANAVHMSMLHEYVCIGAVMPMGVYYQVSNDAHVYEGHWGQLEAIYNEGEADPYDAEDWLESPPLYLSGHRGDLQMDIAKFLDSPNRPGAYRTDFMNEVVAPMSRAYKMYKGDNHVGAIQELKQTKFDWHTAGAEWIERRLARVLPVPFK